MKPVIGITSDVVYDANEMRTGGRKLVLNWNYADAVAQAGGMPVIIPPQSDPASVFELIDGLLIPGGNDIDAKHFGEENHPKAVTIDEDRFESERRLYESAPSDLPVFGICYGCQFLNVVRGGTMIQHLEDELGHSKDTGGTLQEYEIDGDSKIHGIAGEKMSGESWHHQAIRETGQNLKVVAKGEDGVIEAVEATDRPWVVGVQWHPERTTHDPATLKLFKTFVEQAAAYRERKNAAGDH